MDVYEQSLQDKTLADEECNMPFTMVQFCLGAQLGDVYDPR